MDIKWQYIEKLCNLTCHTLYSRRSYSHHGDVHKMVQCAAAIIRPCSSQILTTGEVWGVFCLFKPCFIFWHTVNTVLYVISCFLEPHYWTAKTEPICMVDMSRVTHTCNASRKSLLYVICLIHRPSTFSSLDVVKITLSTVTLFCAASEENFVKMTFPFQGPLSSQTTFKKHTCT